MGLKMFLLIAALAGYSIGLVTDAAANGNDSKLLTLASTGELNSKWLPFSLDDEILKASSYSQTFPFGGGPYYFLETGYLSENTDVFDHATVGFNISTEANYEGTGLINRVNECVFETDVDVDTECVVCIFRDWNGDNIAKGEMFFEPPYLANTPLTIEMTEFLNDDYKITDVRNVKGVQIGICMEDNGGCTPGYWRQPQHNDSWMTYTSNDSFDTVFGVTSSFGSAFELIDAVWLGGGGENALARHAVAALLNTQNGDVNYSLLDTEVIAIVQEAYSTGDFEAAKNILAGENEATCPLN